jgi:hypothetical protein
MTLNVRYFDAKRFALLASLRSAIFSEFQVDKYLDTLPERTILPLFSNAHFRVTFASSSACALCCQKSSKKNTVRSTSASRTRSTKESRLRAKTKRTKKPNSSLTQFSNRIQLKFKFSAKVSFLRFSSLISKSPFFLIFDLQSASWCEARLMDIT